VLLDFGGGYGLRQATADDHPALSRICLLTGDAGRDATEIEDDPSLLGLIYAIPYQVLEPEPAFVIEGPAGPAGYLLGARSTAAFNARLAAEWYPDLQRRIPDAPSDRVLWRGSDKRRHLIHHPSFGVPGALAPYPSHGHIDLLPESRGRGIGRRAMAHLIATLRAMGSTGIHMQLDPRNTSALAFYKAIGFSVLAADGLPEGAITVVKTLG
jgi:GNAT superfamily N-acetyltransferase